MRIKLFGKNECGKCQSTKNKIQFLIAKLEAEDKIDFCYHDVDTVDGMAELAYHDVSQIPTTILEKEDEVIGRWEGEVPHSQTLKEHLTKQVAGLK